MLSCSTGHLVLSNRSSNLDGKKETMTTISLYTPIVSRCPECQKSVIQKNPRMIYHHMDCQIIAKNKRQAERRIRLGLTKKVYKARLTPTSKPKLPTQGGQRTVYLT